MNAKTEKTLRSKIAELPDPNHREVMGKVLDLVVWKREYERTMTAREKAGWLLNGAA